MQGGGQARGAGRSRALAQHRLGARRVEAGRAGRVREQGLGGRAGRIEAVERRGVDVEGLRELVVECSPATPLPGAQ